ncbi:MAG: hypothetical protein ACI30Q_07685 [Muribaculaceae bacterium]
MAHPRCGRPYSIASPYYITLCSVVGCMAIRPAPEFSDLSDLSDLSDACRV